LKHLREDFFKGIKLHKKQNTENKLHTKKSIIYFFYFRCWSVLTPYAVEEQTRKNSNFPVRGIFKNPREIIVNIFR
jgi:hypothetical protein